MKYIPLGNQVLLELHILEKKVNGIIIPDGAGEDVWYGIVMEMGDGVETDMLKIGDKVFYSIFGAKTVEKDKIILVGIDDILCIFEEE